MAQVTLRPLRIGEILDVAIKLYTRNFMTLVKIVTILVVPLELLTVLIQVSIIPDNFLVSSTPTFPGQSPDVHVNGGQLATFIAGNVVILLLSFVLIVLATAASFKAVSDAYLGETPDWRGSLRFTIGKTGSLAWLATLGGFLIVLGFAACVIPGIYLAVAWSLGTPVLLMEGLKGRKALKRSRSLVKDRWWPTAGAYFIGYLISSVVTAAFVAGVTAFIVADQGGSIVVHFLAQAAATSIARVLTTPFQAAVVSIIYFDLRVRKEGFDLQLLAQRVGVEPRAGAPDLLPPLPPEPGSSQPPFWPPPPGWKPDSPPAAPGLSTPPAPGSPAPPPGE